MKKVVIVGGGIAGMVAGIYLQKAGFETELFEKNALAGGQCTGWKRDGYFIDNCIHWLTGTKPGSKLYDLWCEVGALGDGVDVYKKQMFYSYTSQGKTVTFWRDKERTRKELIALSPEDEVEINKFIDAVTKAESMQVPVDKPFDKMGIKDFMALGKEMAPMGAVMKEYGGLDLSEYTQKFKSPLIRTALSMYMPQGYRAY